MTDPEQVLPLRLDDLRALVEDANLMLNYAVSTGYANADGRRPTAEIAKSVVAIREKLAGTTPPSADDVADFKMSYAELASVLSPITAQTLRDTASEEQGLLMGFFWTKSYAVAWSRTLLTIAVFFVGVALYGSYLNRAYGPLPDSGDDELYFIRVFLEILVPFTYGGIGACAYLLKSLHYFIYQRCFDRNRIYEYYNRILLGVIGGGCITLFATYLADDSGNSVTLSAAALGIIAGYNTDLLFAAIERLSNAILPKVDLRSTASTRNGQPKPPVIDTKTLSDAVKQLATATDAAQRDALMKIINQILAKA